METQELNQVYKWVRIALIVLAVFLAFEALGSLKALREPSLNGSVITVSGEGEAFAIPDLATFSFSVSADSKTVGEAQDEVTEKMDAILAGLSDLGIAEKDVKTTDYSVYPKYVYNPIFCITAPCPPGRQDQDGYTASHSVTVKVRDADKAGEALALVGDNGATNLSSVSFTVDDPDQIMAEARSLAIADAESRAKSLAKELGVKIVRVVSFSDGFDGAMPYYRGETMQVGVAADMMKAPTLPTGENKVQVNVSVTYEIR